VRAAITWQARDPAMMELRPASATAVLPLSAEGWTRTPAERVFLRTCAAA